MNAATDVAVIGVGCRFPDARGPEEFWTNLDEGVVSVREIPEDRLRRAGVPEALLNADDYVRLGTSVPGLEDFAAGFFGYSADEAMVIDPQQRIFLEVCWEALESAGHPPALATARRSRTGHVGVFAGTSFNLYGEILRFGRTVAGGPSPISEADLQYGGLPEFLTSRVAHKLNLTGPSVTVMTACSSALTAVHHAVMSLLSGECEIALAGGAGLPAPPLGYRYQENGLLSRDGLCRSFDAASTGTAYGSGVGAVALRRLESALTDGDHILAVIRGSALGNSGARRPGFIAANPSGVADVVATAIRLADLTADRLGYVEAHGFGTPMGDHVELAGLRSGLRETMHGNSPGSCGLGSVKPNIGHTGAAAGIAGLIKAIRIASTGRIPPHPLFERPRDPEMLADSPLHISTEPERAEHRNVLVHSMGLGGTNAAVVVGPPPRDVRPVVAPDKGPVRLVLSARSHRDLDAMAGRLADELEQRRQPLADVEHTLRTGRAEFSVRRVVTGPAGELPRMLRAPDARTVQAVLGKRAVVMVPDELVERAGPMLDRLRAALGSDLEIAPAGRTEASVADRGTGARFLLVLADRSPTGDEPDDGRYVLGLDEEPDDALTVAWRSGVQVNWADLAPPAARRVPLPVYPYDRERFWALAPEALACYWGWESADRDRYTPS